jgi:hypothetical protein
MSALVGMEPACADSSEAAAKVSCGSSISQCGCTITKPGVFTVTAKLSSGQGTTGNGDCIDIKAPNAKLFLQGFALTGVGTGAGIRLLSSANGAFVEGTRAGAGTGQSTISGWDIGIEDDASNTIVEDFESNSNATAGVLLNKAHNSNINDFGASSNGVYGAWLKASSGNQINCSDTDSNTKIGLYVGCSSDGSLGSTCHGVGPSKGNRLYDHSSSDNGSVGIAIDVGDTGNFVTDTQAHGNTSEDLSDQNTNCDRNLWILNNFTNANAGCIH